MIDERWLVGFLTEQGIAASGELQSTEIKTTLPVAAVDREGGLMNLEGRALGDIFSEVPAGSIAAIEVRGVLTKNGYFDEYEWKRVPGMALIGQIITEADKSPNIAGILLIIDSPGGTVDGTESLANQVRNSKTPVLAFVDGLAASAAYWVASQANAVVLSGETSEVGSIGTMIQLVNADGFFKRWGLDVHRINATKSTDKNRSVLEAKEGKYELIRSELLDPVNEVFLKSVREGRKGDINLKQENVLTGKLYLGTNAIKVGLADAIGSHQLAIEELGKIQEGKGSRSAALEGERLINANDSDLSFIKQSGHTMKIKFKSTLAALSAFFGGEPDAEGNHEAEMTAERAAELDARLAAVTAAENRATAAEQRAAAAETQLANIQALAPEATDLVAHFTQVQQERDEYAAASGGGDAGAKGGKDGDDFSGKPKTKTSWEREAEAKFQKA